ncbi:MAG: type II toxin-antitoxin system RelE/ParE family toxin [Vicingaceae bacterium]
MVKIIWTEQATQDLENIFEYISKDSMLYASRTVEKLFIRVSILKQYPTSGRKLKEAPQFYRELIEGNFRIIYKFSSSEVIHIITVFHSARHLTLKDLTS